MLSKHKCCQPTHVCTHKRNNTFVITGDFNYKNIDWDNQYVVTEPKHLKDFIDTIQHCFLYQHITGLMQYRENERPNLLDLIITRKEDMIHNRNLTCHIWVGI